MKKVQWRMESKIGSLFLVASAGGLECVYWQAQNVPFVDSLEGSNLENRTLANAVHQIEEYLNGTRSDFQLQLCPQGTEFQKKVWNELLRVPYGKTLSYADLAAKVGNKNASRAVGSANGKNPLCIVVPCHRVVSSNGGLGGYSGGLQIKEKLLKLEADN